MAALYERDTCEPDQRSRCDKNLQQLINEALQRLPNVSRDQFLEALSEPYQQFKKARRKFPSIPPKA